jgi:hypothetical protein
MSIYVVDTLQLASLTTVLCLGGSLPYDKSLTRTFSNSR